MVTALILSGLILSGYRTRLIGLLGPLPPKDFPRFMAPASLLARHQKSTKVFVFAKGKGKVSALVEALLKARAKRRRQA